MRRTTAQALALRARIVLACAAGDPNQVVARKLGVTPQTVCKWRACSTAQWLDGLHDEPRPGVPRSIDDAKVEAVRSSQRWRRCPGALPIEFARVARSSGISTSSVQRIWRASACSRTVRNPCRPHRSAVRRQQVRDVVGLYMSPPDQRPGASASMKKARCRRSIGPSRCCRSHPARAERRSHDYKRHGTTALFTPRYCHRPGARPLLQAPPRNRVPPLLDAIDAAVPADLDIHLVMDNYATHKAPAIKVRLAKRPRYHLHFTPTYASGSLIRSSAGSRF